MGKRYKIEAVSGLTSWLTYCTIGEGDTIREAWDDALGDRPWTAFQKKLKKGYYLRDREEQRKAIELEAMESNGTDGL